MELFNSAVHFAVEKHNGQKRKTSDAPYILHPMEVAAIVSTMSNDEELLAAAVLHDTVEDTDTTLEEIEDKFGRRVALLVMTETEEKRPDKPPAETWRLRKEESLIILKNTKDIAVKMLWMGDKLSNMRAFYREFLVEGLAVWNKFNQKDPSQQAWYYRSIAKYLAELKDYAAYQEYVSMVDIIFESVETAADDSDIA